MGDITIADRAHLGPKHCGNGGGFAIESKEFNLKSLPLPMDVNDGAHIARLEAILGKIAG